MQIAFLAFCLVLAISGIERDRYVWRVMAAFNGCHLLLQAYVWPSASWVMVCVGAIECLNIAALGLYGWCRTGKALASILAFLSLWSCWFYVDFELGVYLVYDVYNEVITLSTIAMIAIGSDGALNAYRNFSRGLGERLSHRRPALLPRKVGKRSSDRKGIA